MYVNRIIKDELRRKPIKGDIKKTETEENQEKHLGTLVRLTISRKKGKGHP